MIRYWLVAFLAFLTCFPSLHAARILSDQATASLWTVGPGKELYAAFGHSALRITDPVIGFDRLYNFGTFDFATPNFYLKFIRGDLDYYLTAAVALEVLEEYRASQQLVIEQQLNLTPAELDELFLSMEDNLQPERAAYRYDFIRDNCTTRIRDAVSGAATINWSPLSSQSPTLREMVQPYVADRPALRVGIDLLFGANMDHSANAQEGMFLPEDMKLAFDLATVSDGKQPLVRKTQTILTGRLLPVRAFDWLTLASYVLALFGLLAAFQKWNWFRVVDVFVFCTAGAIGCLLLFLWFGTRHWVLHENWNLLWAIPSHLIIWFFPKRLQKVYWLLSAALIVPALFLTHIPILGLLLFMGIRAISLSQANR